MLKISAKTINMLRNQQIEKGKKEHDVQWKREGLVEIPEREV